MQNLNKKMLNNKLIELLIELLKEVLSFQLTTDRLLSSYFHNNKRIGKYERYIIAETIYAVLRNYFKIIAVIFPDLKQHNEFNSIKFTNNDFLNIIGIVFLKILRINNEYFENITCIDFEKIQQLKFLDDICSRTEMPQWLINVLLSYYKEDDIIKLGVAMQQNAPLDLRVNLLKTNMDFVLEHLTKDNLLTQLTPYSPFGVRLFHKSSLAKNDLFVKGLIEVQDESSQLAGILLSPRRGETIVDFCAGSGGKALLISMLMHNTGRVYAFDTHEKRLDNLLPRLFRSGLSNIYPQLIATENDIKVKRLWGKIDRVFIDAPCSGLGTLRRNPDLKFRQNQFSIAELNIKQLSILTAASKLVKPRGYLVYATCSILYEENQEIVNKFLQQNPEFNIIPAAMVLKNINMKFIDENFLILLPHIHNTDGFFAVLLQKS